MIEVRVEAGMTHDNPEVELLFTPGPGEEDDFEIVATMLETALGTAKSLIETRRYSWVAAIWTQTD